MIIRIIICQLVYSMLIWLGIADCANAEEQEKNLTIMADPSLTVVVSLIARDYALKNNVAITTIFSPINEQIRAIENGDASDIIITAKPAFMDSVQQKGLIDVFSKRNIARNNLVLAGVSTNFTKPNLQNAKNLDSFNPNANAEVPDDFMFVVGDVLKTAEGSYALEAIEHYNLKKLLEPKFTFVQSAFETVNMIDEYDAIGVLFRTDAQLFPIVRELEAFNGDTHSPLIYQAAAVVGENMELSREFIIFLSEKSVRDIFREYGFSTFF
jgi:molybdate transport system substrate-binding protein